MCMCDAVPVLAVMTLELPVLVFGVLRWRNPVPRPGVVLAALLAGTTSTMIASAFTLGFSRDPSLASHAHRTLALAGAALAVLVHVAARQPKKRASEPIAAARAIARVGRREGRHVAAGLRCGGRRAV